MRRNMLMVQVSGLVQVDVCITVKLFKKVFGAPDHSFGLPVCRREKGAERISNQIQNQKNLNSDVNALPLSETTS